MSTKGKPIAALAPILLRPFATPLAVAAVLATVTAVTAAVAQQPRFLSLTPPEGLAVIPLFEGWTANPDGSRSFSFGAINRNKVAVDIPLGEGNYLEPAAYNGFQPTHFPPGRITGIFVVTVPAEAADIDVWWHLQTGDGEVLKVPGRARFSAYELDFVRPRPQGALQPLAAFDDNELRAGLMAGVSDYPETVVAGEEVVFIVKGRDPSDRDPSDPRFGKPLDMGVALNKYQGPGDVAFFRNPDTPEPVNPYDEDDRRFRFWRKPGTNEAAISGGAGEAMVIAVFSAPGEYLIHAKVDNFRAPDSSDVDQCCWTNLYQRVRVTE